jgi:hypothetical protein
VNSTVFAVRASVFSLSYRRTGPPRHVRSTYLRTAAAAAATAAAVETVEVDEGEKCFTYVVQVSFAAAATFRSMTFRLTSQPTAALFSLPPPPPPRAVGRGAMQEQQKQQ